MIQSGQLFFEWYSTEVVHFSSQDLKWNKDFCSVSEGLGDYFLAEIEWLEFQSK